MSKMINIRRPKKNKLIVLFILTAMVLLIVVGAIIYIQNSDTPPDRTKITDSAKTLLEQNNTEGAIKLYDDAIASTKDANLKDALLGDKFVIYYNAGDYNRATEIADIFNNLDKSSSLEEYIAEMYENEGKKDKAIVHYEKAIQYVKSDNPIAKADVEYYQSRINLLKE